MEKWIKRIGMLILVIFSLLIALEIYFAIINIDLLNVGLVKIVREFISWIFSLYIITIAVVIFLENKDPGKTLSWLIVLFLVPVLGFVFYILFGRSYSRKIKRKIKNYRESEMMVKAANIQRDIIDYINIFEDDSIMNKRLLNLLLKNSDTPFTVNNTLEVLTNGESTFSKIIEMLLEATDHIHLEYFIIRDDEIGNKIKDILILKAKSGVKVRIIYDSVGSWKLGRKYKEELIEAGVRIKEFFPVIFPILSRELNYRNHRKIIVIDGKIGFVGGLNIGDEYLGKNPNLGFWRDTHLMIRGDAVYSLQQIFISDWYHITKETLKFEELFPRQDVCGDKVVQITASGPDSDWKSIHQGYFTMISTAEKRVWITTPYLVPDNSLKMALISSALSGVDVRIIIPSKADHFFVYWASRDNIEDLLEAGVRIYAYTNGFIHSKIFLVDSKVASLGTANLDIRSLEINFEVNAFIYDKEIVEILENDFMDDLSMSEEIEYKNFIERGLGNRFLESLGRIVSPLQ